MVVILVGVHLELCLHPPLVLQVGFTHELLNKTESRAMLRMDMGLQNMGMIFWPRAEVSTGSSQVPM